MPRRIKTVVETKGGPGEVGGKWAASCASYLEALMVENKGFVGP